MKVNVLSLFDGISCGMVALERAGIKVDKYYASEIDKDAIIVSNKNYPNIIRLGDVKKWREWDIDWSSIDVVIGGSPCQGFSIAGKRLNFKDERSKLVFEYIDIVEHVKSANPDARFLLENVKMRKECQDVISDLLGVQPVMIDSNLVSAQNRKRLYWTNIPGIVPPEDKGIMLSDIVHENHSGDAKIALEPYLVPYDKSLAILDKEVERGKIGYFRQDSQANRVYSIHGKAVTLCGSAGGGAAKMGQYLFGCITPDIMNKQQNGQRFSDGKKFYALTARDRHGVLVDGYIRKLTPVECERLQTLPDNYTEGLKDCKRYKLLGNAWTVDVIAHILGELKYEYYQ